MGSIELNIPAPLFISWEWILFVTFVTDVLFQKIYIDHHIINIILCCYSGGQKNGKEIISVVRIFSLWYLTYRNIYWMC